MDRNLALEAIRITEAAALAAARLRGRGDRNGAGQAAVEAMRRGLGALPVDGLVVIGAGERDEAPMLYVGERVGRCADGDDEVEMAVDSLEGTNLCATGAPNAISALVIGPRGSILRLPPAYMEKIAVGPRARGTIDITKSPAENLRAVAAALCKSVEDLTVVILDRPRHEKLMRKVREAGARIKLIGDGDVVGALSTCFSESGVDVLLGTGGASEGVVSAAALRCLGGDIQGRLAWRSDRERERAHTLGLKDLDRILSAEDLAGGEIMFAATGVTGGDLLNGVRFTADGAITHSLAMRSKTRTIRYVETIHHFVGRPNYGW
ncbi:MAG TPA: class II fructose-bisphosphatase [Anaeromyxobacteraceae bacterium]|nr:class II fructose-bisphosphatase [Anaeromyxobacteraceae bacterium]